MRKDGIQLRVSDVFYAILKRWKLIASLTFIGFVLGLFLSGMTYVQSNLQTFNISGSVAVTTFTNNTYLGGNLRPASNDFTLAGNMVDSVIYLLKSDRVLNEVLEDTEIIGVSAAQVKNAMSVNQYANTQILTISLRWNVAEEGVAIWTSLISVMNKTMPATLQVGSLSVINEPSATVINVGGSENGTWLVLAAFGMMAGSAFAVLELLLHPTLTNIKDIETEFGLETIGIIPRNNSYFQANQSILMNTEDEHNPIIQNYSTTAYILKNRIGSKNKHYCFYVTSAAAQEGKTTAAANLAIQLADMEHKTLLVDFNTKNPTLSSLFLNNVDYEHSLNALYRGEITKGEAVTRLTGYLDILPTVLEHNAIVIDGLVVELINDLKKDYDYVILDAPPVGVVSNTLSLNQLADSALFVVGYDMASLPEIQKALETLEKSGVRILGCIVNAAQTKSSKGFGKDVKGKPVKKQKSREKEPGFKKPGREEKDTLEEVLKGNNVQKKKEKETKKDIPSRNIMDELTKEDELAEAQSGSDIMEKLLELGITGDFGQEE